MKNLFARLYLLLILTFLGLGWSLDQLYDEFGDDQEVTSDLALHRGTLFLLNRELTRLPSDLHQDYVSALSPSFGYPISFVSEQALLSDLASYQQNLSDDQLAHLSQGGQLSVIDQKQGLSWFFQRHESTDKIIVLGPIHLLAEGDNTKLSALFLLVLALVVFIWLWPLSQGLLLLTRTAQQFGDGDFSARVPSTIARPLQPLALRFNAMAARIQRLIRSHKELSHAVSHELRTPIARIRFAMEMTREVQDADKRSSYFDTVDNNIEELDGLVDELLTYARFDREEPKLDFVSHDLLKISQEVATRFEMTEGHLSFVVKATGTSPCVAECDHDAMVRVLDNLLRNAIRYAVKQIEIHVYADDETITIEVMDDGPGVPKANWDTLFDPFVRLDQSRDRSSGGIGLGLAIVRRYMEWHQGTAKVANANPTGAKFILEWPLQQG